MRETSSFSMPRRSLSAPCATIRHICCSLSASESVEGEFLLKVVEATSSLANPRVPVAKGVSLFPCFTTKVLCSPESRVKYDDGQILSNSRLCEQRGPVGVHDISDHCSIDKIQIDLLNEKLRSLLPRCSELEQENTSLRHALKQQVDEKLQLRSRLEECLKERDALRQLVASLRKS